MSDLGGFPPVLSRSQISPQTWQLVWIHQPAAATHSTRTLEPMDLSILVPWYPGTLLHSYPGPVKHGYTGALPWYTNALFAGSVYKFNWNIIGKLLPSFPGTICSTMINCNVGTLLVSGRLLLCCLVHEITRRCSKRYP